MSDGSDALGYISASRIEKYLSCGEQYRKRYVLGEPSQRSGSAALFGSVIHKGLEGWALDRSQDILPLMKAAWLTVTEGTVVSEFITEYQLLAVEVIKAEKECADAFEARTGKPSKMVQLSGEWKKHPVKKKVDRLFRKYLARLDAESPWRFSEYDPLPRLYNESLVLARRYEADRGGLPNALCAEFSFTVESWDDLPPFHGFIDALEPVFGEPGELVGIDVVDYKTYAKEPTEMKDWRQGAIYDLVVRRLAARGALACYGVPGDLDAVTIRVLFDYPRLRDRKVYRMGDGDYAQLRAECEDYVDGVSRGRFLPAAKGSNPDFCDYPENCCQRSRPGCAQPEAYVAA